VGKVAFQNSDGTYWTLTDDDPVTWAAKTVEAGASGAAAFTDLTDVPTSYTGQSLKLVRVNTGETALEFVAAGAGTGDVVGPASATAGHLAVFGADPQHIEDGGAVPTGGTGSPASNVYIASIFV
jgi:hypothetical protein